MITLARPRHCLQCARSASCSWVYYSQSVRCEDQQFATTILSSCFRHIRKWQGARAIDKVNLATWGVSQPFVQVRSGGPFVSATLRQPNFLGELNGAQVPSDRWSAIRYAWCKPREDHECGQRNQRDDPAYLGPSVHECVLAEQLNSEVPRQLRSE